MPEKEFTKPIGTSKENRIRLKIVTDRGVLVDVMVQYEALIRDEWLPIVRYDTSHGFPHRDVLHPNKTKDKHPLSFPDLKTFLFYAEQDLKDRWEWYRERFLKEMNSQ